MPVNLNMRYAGHQLAIGAALITLLTCAGAHAQTAPEGTANPIDADGTVHVPGFALPPSAYISKEARDAMPRRVRDPEEPMIQALAAGKAGEQRAHIGQYMAPRIKHYTDQFAVTLTDTTIAGIAGVIVKPSGPIPASNRHKVLLDLPGGGFVMGAAPGTGMLESIPLAAMAKIEIVSITYRQAPEYTYPAASEDVVKAQNLSSAVNTHRELVKAGVDAELHVWDGLDHAFFYNIDLPESREAFDVMTRFFSKHLGLTQ